jgi:hypothetical protein
MALVHRRDGKAEQGALRVMAPCLMQGSLKVIKVAGGRGTRPSRGWRHGGSLLAAPLDACCPLSPHPGIFTNFISQTFYQTLKSFLLILYQKFMPYITNQIQPPWLFFRIINGN